MFFLFILFRFYDYICGYSLATRDKNLIYYLTIRWFELQIGGYRGGP